MAAYNKFNVFVEDLMKKVHDLANDAIKVYLSNAAPAATHTIKANVAEIAAGNGYPAGGISVTPVVSRAGGTATLEATDATITASGGTVGPFRYVPVYNDTPTSPADPLIGWWDRGAALTLQDGESFTVDFQGDKIFDLS